PDASAAAASAMASSGEDINLVAFLHHLVFAQLQLAIGDAFAGLHVVFVAVPRAHEMHLGLGEVQSLRGLVREEAFLDLGDGEALAGRSPLVQAEIAVGVELSFVAEDADLVVAGKHDAPVAVLELPDLAYILLGHPGRLPTDWHRFVARMSATMCGRAMPDRPPLPDFASLIRATNHERDAEYCKPRAVTRGLEASRPAENAVGKPVCLRGGASGLSAFASLRANTGMTQNNR